MQWNCAQFDELTVAELYRILQLRSAVFVLEQDCIYQDMDDCDQVAYHLTGSEPGRLLCYARILPPQLKYQTPSIGRIVTAKQRRGDGLGKQLARRAIAACEELWPAAGITISAQHYLERFYRELGFVTESEPYQEDGIPHIEMRRPAG